MLRDIEILAREKIARRFLPKGTPPSRQYHHAMKIATGTVVKGKVVADELSLADGTTVYIVARDDREKVALSADELADLEAGIAEANRGELVPGDEFLDELRRFE